MVDHERQKNRSNSTFTEGRGGGQGKPRTPSGNRENWQPPAEPTPGVENVEPHFQAEKLGSNPITNGRQQEQLFTNQRNRRYIVKLMGVHDPQPELQQLWDNKFLEDIFDDTPIFHNRPMTGRRGKCQEMDIDLVAGFIAPGTTRQSQDGLDGPGIYAVAVVLSQEVRLIRSLIGAPFGLDITIDQGANKTPYPAIVSVDIVVDPRGTGKVIKEMPRT